MSGLKPIRKLLVANRSEIAIRVFRSAHELNIRTVAIYSHEDRYALHRFKADEAYKIGKTGEPIRTYLDIEAIMAVCREHGVDAIHPGYGFLSENPALAQACQDNGIIWIGPRVELLQKLGDKTAAREIADLAKVPILAGSPAVTSLQDAQEIAARLTYPVMLKAAHGGGGRGMRVVLTAEELAPSLEQAQRESQAAFGSSEVFIENTSPAPSISKCNCWETCMATWCICSSEIAPYNAAIRRWWKSRRRPISILSFATICATPRWRSATR